MYFKVVEKFISINGEGQKSGELAIFIRLAGCNLKCRYCDTLWANDPDVLYEKMTKEAIYDYIIKTGVKNITLTGGEPLLDASVTDLIETITHNPSLYLEIETNGSILIEPYRRGEVSNLAFTVDYKSNSSSMESYMNLDNFNYLNMQDTLKFVVGHMADLEKAYTLIKKYKLTDQCKVLLSPIFGEIELSDIVEFMKSKVLNDVKLQVQLHKIIWDVNLKGV